MLLNVQALAATQVISGPGPKAPATRTKAATTNTTLGSDSLQVTSTRPVKPLPATIWRTANQKPTPLTLAAVGASALTGALVGAKLAGSRKVEGAIFGAAVGLFVASSLGGYAVTGKVPVL